MSKELKKYQIIYADPPWRYDFSKSNNRKIENQYQTMTVKELKELQIPCEKDSVLYLWATTAKLLESIEVLNAWGFTYKSSMVWDKETIGMGYWFRGQHEFLFACTKGKFSPPPQPLRVSSIFREKKTKHSKKPQAVRGMISRWYPDCTKVELFAREKTEGWDVWGNEVESDIELGDKL